MEKAPPRAAAPTGCYKCGRPGHWSRDCPSDGPNDGAAPPGTSATAGSAQRSASFSARGSLPAAAEPKPKVRKTRPKLDPELFLSDGGIGFVLRHFPRNFKYRGRGHEVSDLGNLIGMYKEWHSRLLPYYSFTQFVHKVEQVSSTKRVRTCLRDLRERVANGGDPTKLHEPLVTEDVTNDGQENFPPDFSRPEEAMVSEGLFDEHNGPSSRTPLTDDMQEDMLDEIYANATEEPAQASFSNNTASEVPSTGGTAESSQPPNNVAGSSGKIHITEEQKARMEANRLRALERAAARGRSSLAG